MRGYLWNRRPIGCMRVFMTAFCRSETSRSSWLTARSSACRVSVSVRPARMSLRSALSRFLVRPISPDRLSTWSRREVSTRIELSRWRSPSRRPVGALAPGRSVARRPRAAATTGSAAAGGRSAGAASSAGSGAAAIGAATAAPPVTAAKSASQSGSPGRGKAVPVARGCAATATAAGALSGATAAAADGDASIATRRASSNSGAAGPGRLPRPRSTNMSRTTPVADRITSMRSGVDRELALAELVEQASRSGGRG